MACFPGQKAGAPPSAPTTPSNLTATPQPSGTQILLQWNPSIDGDITVSYILRRCSGVGCTNFTVITNTVANAVNYVDSGLQISTSYSYTVQAIDGAGNLSGLSNIATTSTRALPQNTAQQQSPAIAALKWPQDLWSVQSENNIGSLVAAVLKPTIPANFTATAVSSSQINLSWSASTEPNVPISLYTIVISPGSITVQVSAPATTYSNTGLTASTTYSYILSATDIHGNTSGTTSTSATTETASAGLSFPRISIVATGGEQSYGQDATTGFTSYSASGPGTAVYTDIQILGSYDLVWGLGAGYEGWPTGAAGVTRNKQDLVQAIKAKGTYPNVKNAARTPYVFLYCNMEAAQNVTSGAGYQGYSTQIINNNWWTYETPGGVGTIVPSAATGSGWFEVNYAYAWDTAAGAAALDNPICSHVYGSASNGMGPAQTAAQYHATALLTTNRTADSRFTNLNTNNAAPNADGLVLDNVFLYPNAGGNLAGIAVSWDGIGTQGNNTSAAYPSGASSLLARGQYHFFQQYQSYLATVNPGLSYLNMGNFGSYANTIGIGNTHTISAGAMDSVLHGGLLEGVAGFSGSSWQTYQTAAQVMTNYAYGLGYCQAPQLLNVGVVLPATDGSSTASFLTAGTTQTVSTGTALEYQMMRCMLTFTLMNNGLFAAGVDGYNWAVTRWYDEYGDDSLTQVNVKRGYLGQPTASFVTLSNGMYLRQFQSGVALCNPWGNGSVTLTAAQLTSATGISGYTLLKGTQQTSINTGNSFSSYTFADGDGLILVIASALTITNVNPLTPQATVGSAYGKTMSATGGVPPYAWSMVSATPNTGNWVSVTSAGVVQGTPTTAETETITIKVADSASNSTQTPYTLVVNAASPAPTGAIGTLAAGTTFTVNGSGFGTQGPTILLFDDFEGNTPGSKISLTEPPIGQWTSFNSSNGFTASNVAAHTGSVSFNVNDVNQITNGTGTQAAPNILNLSLGGNQTEIFLSYWAYTPNSQFPGEYGNNNVAGTEPSPGTFPTDSCWKFAWLMDSKNNINGPFNMCIPTYTGGGVFQVEGAQYGILGNFGNSWFSFTSWNRIAAWLRGAPSATGTQSTGFLQTLNTQIGMNTFQFGTAASNPLFTGSATEFSYINFPGYTAVANKNQLPLYDDVYVAVGAGSVARVEIGDAATYTSCTHMTILLSTSWANGSVTATVPRTGLDNSASTYYVYVTNSQGVVNSTGFAYTPSAGPSFTPIGNITLSGTIAEGQLLTLGGSALSALAGTIGPRLIYYKNYANETSGSRIVNGPDFIDSTIVTAGPNGNGYAYCQSGVGLPYSLGMIVSNDSRIGNEDSGASYGGANLVFASVIPELFSSSVLYFPASCSYTSLVSAGNPQIKLDWAYGTSISDTDIYHKVCNQAIALGYVMDSDTAPWDGKEFGTNTQWVWTSAPYPKTGVPICNHRWVQLNAPAGSGTGNIMVAQVWDGTAQTINVSDNGVVMAASGGTNGYLHFNMPGFVQDTTLTDPNWSVANNRYVIEGEKYVAMNSSGNQGAAARIEIGDASTYAACTRLAKCTVESSSWWTGTNVQFRLREGVFSGSLTGKYLYVTNAQNVTSPLGHF